jgi:hypothetical protein
MRILLWLFAGPAVALFAASLLGPLSPLAAVGAALAGQGTAYPIWQWVERRRAAAALRQLRHRPGVSITRVRLTRGEETAQLALQALCAVLVALAFLLVAR